VVASVENSADETGLDGRRGHPCDHDRRFTEKPREGRVKVNFSIATNPN
jgi:hypothetical protein